MIANHSSHEKQIIQGVRENSEEQTKNYKACLILKQFRWETYQEELSKELCRTQKIRPYEKIKKKNYCKIPFPPHSRSLRTRAERCQRIIDPVQKNAVYDVQQRRKKK